VREQSFTITLRSDDYEESTATIKLNVNQRPPWLSEDPEIIPGDKELIPGDDIYYCFDDRKYAPEDRSVDLKCDFGNMGDNEEDPNYVESFSLTCAHLKELVRLARENGWDV
jgi:hypothetical protein